jgi:hypothetical protein
MSTVFETHPAPRAAAPDGLNESSASAASWSAIFAGTITAGAATLILGALGSGLGLATISPWPNSGASATTFSVMPAIWLIVIQWISALMGGYITGRLRTKWAGTHTHEVFFRDTAHGFATWALSTLIGAVLLTSTLGSVAGKSVNAASTVAAGAARGATQAGAGSLADRPTVASYDVDRLLRSGTTDNDASKSDPRPEIARILAEGLNSDGIPSDDRDYLIKLIAAKTGISEADATKRVDQALAKEKSAEVQAREAADAARKAAATASIFLALSMLIGAFISSAAAALGGRLRDLHP